MRASRVQPIVALVLHCVMLVTRGAAADPYLFEGSFAVGTGLEGADPGIGELVWQRARLRVMAGVDLRDNEGTSAALGFRGFAELERRGSVGGEVRYELWLERWFSAYGTITAVLVPKTLFGAGVGTTLLLPFGRRLGWFVEPSFIALPLGGDLPEDSVILWGLVNFGAKVSLAP